MARPQHTKASKMRRLKLAGIRNCLFGSTESRRGHPWEKKLAVAVIDQAVNDWVMGGEQVRRAAGYFIKYGETFPFWLDAADIHPEYLHRILSQAGYPVKIHRAKEAA